MFRIVDLCCIITFLLQKLFRAFELRAPTPRHHYHRGIGLNCSAIIIGVLLSVLLISHTVIASFQPIPVEKMSHAELFHELDQQTLDDLSNMLHLGPDDVTDNDFGGIVLEHPFHVSDAFVDPIIPAPKDKVINAEVQPQQNAPKTENYRKPLGRDAQNEGFNSNLRGLDEGSPEFERTEPRASSISQTSKPTSIPEQTPNNGDSTHDQTSSKGRARSSSPEVVEISQIPQYEIYRPENKDKMLPIFQSIQPNRKSPNTASFIPIQISYPLISSAEPGAKVYQTSSSSKDMSHGVYTRKPSLYQYSTTAPIFVPSVNTKNTLQHWLPEKKILSQSYPDAQAIEDTSIKNSQTKHRSTRSIQFRPEPFSQFPQPVNAQPNPQPMTQRLLSPNPGPSNSFEQLRPDMQNIPRPLLQTRPNVPLQPPLASQTSNNIQTTGLYGPPVSSPQTVQNAPLVRIQPQPQNRPNIPLHQVFLPSSQVSQLSPSRPAWQPAPRAQLPYISQSDNNFQYKIAAIIPQNNYNPNINNNFNQQEQQYITNDRFLMPPPTSPVPNMSVRQPVAVRPFPYENTYRVDSFFTPNSQNAGNEGRRTPIPNPPGQALDFWGPRPGPNAANEPRPPTYPSQTACNQNQNSFTSPYLPEAPINQWRPKPYDRTSFNAPRQPTFNNWPDSPAGIQSLPFRPPYNTYTQSQSGPPNWSGPAITGPNQPNQFNPVQPRLQQTIGNLPNGGSWNKPGRTQFQPHSSTNFNSNLANNFVPANNYPNPQFGGSSQFVNPGESTSESSNNIESATNTSQPATIDLSVDRGNVPFYSQADVDRYYRGLPNRTQEAQGDEFEDDSSVLQWHLQQAEQFIHQRDAAKKSEGAPDPVVLNHPQPTTPTQNNPPSSQFNNKFNFGQPVPTVQLPATPVPVSTNQQSRPQFSQPTGDPNLSSGGRPWFTGSGGSAWYRPW